VSYLILFFTFLTTTSFAHESQCDQRPTLSPAATALFVAAPDGMTPTETYVRNLYLALTGAPKPIYDPHFQKAVSYVNAGQPLLAAQLIETDSNFLSVRVRAFAIPFIDSQHQASDTLNDLQALIIGITRDELDARLLLTGDLRYSGYKSLGLPAVSRANNDHYAQFDAKGLDFNSDLERVDKQWEDLDYVAGALTTRAWAQAYYTAGTNRLGVKFTIDEFLCTPIDTWKIAGMPDAFVRRDVDRAQGGDPGSFQNTCRNCHGVMDAMGGAFAKLDYTADGFIFQPDGVVAKMNKNAHFYPAGFVSTDDSWVNVLSDHPTIDFGWRDGFQGVGLASLAKTLADSQAFSRCMVQRVFSSVCGSEITSTDGNRLQPLADQFENDSYNLKNLFANVALENACVSQSTSGVMK
jgi:hypothetical protein